MNVRRLVVLAAAVALAGTLPANAAPKPISETYAVVAPVPFPMTTDVPNMDGCWNGEETLSKNSKPLTFTTPGSFTAELTYMGDWDLYLFDAKGAKAAASETTEEGNAGVMPGKEKVVFKKIKPGAEYTLVACNWLGQKDATVTYTFTPAT